jgi:hypothetical protein
LEALIEPEVLIVATSRGAKLFTEQVEKATNGELKIRLHLAGTLQINARPWATMSSRSAMTYSIRATSRRSHRV